MKRHMTERAYKDPVCGMTLSRVSAAEELEYEGRTYYFCAPSCRERFEQNPEAFIPHHRQHGVRTR